MGNETNAVVRQRFIVQGTVQGVGFRPFVYGQARHWGLAGFVLNDNRGVVAEVEGSPEAVVRFEQALREEAPPLARIDALIVEHLSPRGETAFAIAASQSDSGGIVRIPSDVAPCEDCLREVFDPSDRRYRYPFTNCTNCGPRFTIIENMPYDREKTTMREFPMCPTCQAEYDDPLNRRFFAQPNSCAVCGPQIRLLDASAHVLDVADPIAAAAERLARGALLAIKGLGGYALACAATDQAAVQRLRQYQHRAEWPFPLMVPDLVVARQLCELTEAEADALQSRQRPIVLLRRAVGCSLPPDVASSHGTLGILLPYTPLHSLLMRSYAAAVGPEHPPVLVMGRGSIRGEPTVYQDDDALVRLLAVADAMLTDNRAISIHCDDSVARIVGGEAQLLRRSRGYVPQPIQLPVASPVSLLAVGAGHATTFCFVTGRQAFLSQHLGDTVSAETDESFRESIAHYQRFFGQPEALAYDEASGIPPSVHVLDTAIPRKVGIAHQHAHIASVLAEHGVDTAVIGIVADSPHLGTDGTLWGCDVMIADLLEFERQAHLVEVQVPADSDARRQPWRMAVAYLKDVYGDDMLALNIPIVQELAQHSPDGLTELLANKSPTIGSSSLTCLFDAVAALVGLGRDVPQEDLFEGWGVAQLEAMAQHGLDPYPIRVNRRKAQVLAVDHVLRAIVGDLEHGVDISHIAGRFHSTIADMLATSARQVCKRFGSHVVVLSGDVFQDQLLLEDLKRRLEASTFEVLINREVPPNDGGVSLGQAAVAAARLQHHRDDEQGVTR